MAKRISLAVHRNSVEKRRRAVVRDDLMHAISTHFRDTDVRAYALVTISADGRARAFWDTGAIVPMWGFPGMIHSALTRDLAESGVDEDWRPPLPAKRSNI